MILKNIILYFYLFLFSLDFQFSTAQHDHEIQSLTDEDSELFSQTYRYECDHERCGFGCFYPLDQRSCITRSRCEVLVIIQSVTDNDHRNKIKVHLMGYRTVRASVKKPTVPRGYIAVGFSEDYRMQDDLVIVCQFHSRDKMDVTMSWNLRHTNAFDASVSRSFRKEYMEDLKIGVTTHDSEFEGNLNKDEKMYCSWTMPQEVRVNLSRYSSALLGHSKTIYVDFRNDTNRSKRRKLASPETESYMDVKYILLASGEMLYHNGAIGYHDFRQVARTTYSPEEVLMDCNNIAAPLQATFFKFNLFITIALSYWCCFLRYTY